MLFLLVYFLLMYGQVHSTTDFDVALIGFGTNTYWCNDRHNSLTWHRRVSPLKYGQPIDHCVWRSRTSDRHLEKAIADIISNNTLQSRGNSRLVCVAVSSRYRPVIEWSALGSAVQFQAPQGVVQTEPLSSTPRHRCSQGFKTISTLRIDHTSMAYQCTLKESEMCRIQNQCERKFLLEGKVIKATGDNTTIPTFQCGILTDSVCAKYTQNESRLVPVAPLGIEEDLKTIFAGRQGLMKRLCQLLYPSCSNESDPASGLVYLCREDCYTLRYHCSRHWSTLARYLANHFPQRRWTGCAQLPSAMDQGSLCRQVTPRPFRKDQLTMQCYKKDDRHYVGRVDKTQEGYVCQRWDSMCPRLHEKWPEWYPELQGAENYCRNPGGDRPRPWCFIADPTVPMAMSYCDIPECPHDPSTPTDAVVKQSSTSTLTLCLGVILVLALSTVVLWVCRRRLQGQGPKAGTRVRYLSQEDTVVIEPRSPTMARYVSMWNIPQNELYFQNDRGLDQRLEPLEVPSNSWTVIERLAVGENNDVLLATSYLTNQRPLVVKTLKNSNERWLFDSFVHEACIVASCNHPRIVHLLGVSFLTEPTCILFEYVPLGDLKSILEAEGSPNDGQEGPSRSWDPTLRHPWRQVDICYQIVDGMVYLTNQRIVHRDLAARNILVDEKLQVKISDFGLSKRVDRVGGIYLAPDGERLPIRWTAPEAWSRRQFSTKSDVWSFGVVVWEILALGMQPYMGMSHQEVVNSVVNLKETLKTPRMVNGDQVISSQLMEPCFAHEAEMRPEFIALLAVAAILRGKFSTDM